MKFFALTLSHRDTSAESLRAVLSSDVWARLAAHAAGNPDLVELVLLRTCLRAELYGVARVPESIALRCTREIGSLPEGSPSGFRLLVEEEAVSHLLRVTSGFESLLVGETSVATQVRTAYREAVDRGLAGPWLHRVFHLALRTSRRIRSEANATMPSSLSALALENAQADLGPLRSVLIIGGGAAGKAALRAAEALSIPDRRLATSDPARFEAGVTHESTTIWPGNPLAAALRGAQLVIAVSDRGPIVNADLLASLPNEERPRLVFDLANPPNCAPDCARAGVPIRGLLDLRPAASEDGAMAIDAAEPVFQEAVAQYAAWRHDRGRTGRWAEDAPVPGKVYLVGAGPGDPQLLTVRARALLEKADIVFHDALVPDALLSILPAGTRRVPVGRRAGAVRAPFEQTLRSLVDWARRGSLVVRLKGGDPSIFGRLSEESEALRAAGIPFEVVPGISAALAGAASLGASLTARSLATACAFVTYEPGEGADADLRRARFVDLARAADTLAIYMGGSNPKELAARLLEAGRDPESAIAIIERTSWPDERVHWRTLAELAEQTHSFETPALYLTGPTLANARPWPLAGITEAPSRHLEEDQ